MEIEERFYDIPVDALKEVMIISLKLPLTILICGLPQIGKSTFNYYFGNRYEQLARGIPLQDATWREWNYKKYTATSPDDFVRIATSNRGKFIALEEAGEQMNYLEWWSKMSQVFDSQVRTQGYFKNIYSLITPHFKDLVKHNLNHLNYIFLVADRKDKLRFAKIKPRRIEISYFTSKDPKPRFKPAWDITYPYEFLAMAREYTTWLIKFKEKIKDKNLEKVGLKNTYKCFKCNKVKKGMEFEDGVWWCPNCYDIYVMGK